MNARPATALRVAGLALLLLSLGACELPDPPQPTTPRPTAQTIIEITPAPTQDIDATATAYALVLIPTPTPAGLYVVQAGDTLGAIAARFDTTVQEIMAANGLTDPDAILAGQTLIIPSEVDSELESATAAPIPSTAVTATSTPDPDELTPTPATP